MKTGLFFIPVFLLAVLTASGCGGDGNSDDVNENDIVNQDVQGDSVVGNDVTGDGTVVHDVAPQDIADDDLAQVDAVVTDITDDAAADVASDVPVVDAGDVSSDAVEPENIALNPEVSACGGFVATREDTNCGDERLQWSVDSVTGVVSFTNLDVFLNCCGLHSVTITVVDGVYVITEIDEPEEGGARCDCMCLFDFAAGMPAVDGTQIQVRIERLVTDSGENAEVVWEGGIDLSAGTGEVVIEEDVGWCTEPVNLGVNPNYSACGGFTATREAAVTCGDDTLDWTFDAGTGTVSFVNSNVSLNCCGDHSMSLYLDGGVYTIAEVDAPAAEGGRCFCTCLFDYSIDLPDMVSGVIDVRVTRDVTDSGAGAVDAWSGTIDLSAGSGSIIIQEDVGICG